MENGFLFLDEMLHDVRWDVKYVTWDNFTGEPVDGYEVSRVIGTGAVASVLRETRTHAAVLGYGLLLQDGCRPGTTVDCFLCWIAQLENDLAREKPYSNIERAKLITKGCVVSQSSHGHRSAIGLTLYRLGIGGLVSVGNNLDFMDGRSYHIVKGIGDAETQNRRCLHKIMENSGFQSCRSEWWHYKLVDEPYPGIYFNLVAS